MNKKKTLIFSIVVLVAILGLMGYGIILNNQGQQLNINMVSGTEYQPGEDGKISVELRNFKYEPVVANCSTAILYPNGSYFESGAWMNTTILGTYYYDFTVPVESGIYEYSSTCEYGNKNFTVGKSFHVSGTGLKAWTTQ